MEETRDTQNRWYFKPWMIFLAILCFGPLGLIPLWFRPGTGMIIKIGVSLIVIALTYYMTLETIRVYRLCLDSYQEIAALYK